MNNVNFNFSEVTVYRKQPGEREVHVKSGFRIAHFQRRISYEPLNEIRPRAFEYYSLCHLLEGEGWYWSPGKEIQYFSAGSGILSTPGFVQSYGGFNGNFIEDFICFDGPVADYLFRSGVIENGVVSIGKERRLLPVINEALNLSDSGQISANGLMQSLLYDLYREKISDPLSPSHNDIENLLAKLSSRTNYWWTVSEMAEFCHLSENQFRRVFKKRTGMSPKLYSDSLKMQIASEKLLSSTLGLSAIAEQLGYIDRYHFSKVFKRIKGMSPDLFRKEYPLIQP
jgi:AraC-like DNA-binding protein